MDNRPIGMFDSGVGGLSVLKEYINILPNESFIYYGDNARLPYGDKSEEKIIEYAKEIIEFLISRDVKMIVIACGTVSAIAFEQIKDLYDIPIKAIITPTSKNISDKNIGVIATPGTIKSNIWEKEIHKYSSNSNVTSIACPMFVPLIEDGIEKNEKELRKYVREYLAPFFNTKIDSLVLGCTHYPLISNLILDELGYEPKLINIGTLSAIETKEFLVNNNICTLSRKIPEYEFHSSDAKKFSITLAENLLGFKINKIIQT